MARDRPSESRIFCGARVFVDSFQGLYRTGDACWKGILRCLGETVTLLNRFLPTAPAVFGPFAPVSETAERLADLAEKTGCRSQSGSARAQLPQ